MDDSSIALMKCKRGLKTSFFVAGTQTLYSFGSGLPPQGRQPSARVPSTPQKKENANGFSFFVDSYDRLVEDGVEFEPVKEGVTELYFSSDNDSCAGMVFGAVVRPDWYCFGINFLRMGSEYPNERVQFRLSGLPEDNVNVDIPIFFNSTSLSVYGTVVLSGTLRNGNWNASNDLPAAINGLVGRPFTKAFVIR